MSKFRKSSAAASDIEELTRLRRYIQMRKSLPETEEAHRPVPSRSVGKTHPSRFQTRIAQFRTRRTRFREAAIATMTRANL